MIILKVKFCTIGADEGAVVGHAADGVLKAARYVPITMTRAMIGIE